jgi:hypothetical protein
LIILEGEIKGEGERERERAGGRDGEREGGREGESARIHVHTHTHTRDLLDYFFLNNLNGNLDVFVHNTVDIHRAIDQFLHNHFLNNFLNDLDHSFFFDNLLSDPFHLHDLLLNLRSTIHEFEQVYIYEIYDICRQMYTYIHANVCTHMFILF